MLQMLSVMCVHFFLVQVPFNKKFRPTKDDQQAYLMYSADLNIVHPEQTVWLAYSFPFDFMLVCPTVFGAVLVHHLDTLAMAQHATRALGFHMALCGLLPLFSCCLGYVGFRLFSAIFESFWPLRSKGWVL